MANYDYKDFSSITRFRKMRKFVFIPTPLTEDEYDQLTEEEKECFKKVEY